MAARPRLLMIDNVDSFTFMLVDYLRSAGGEVTVVRNTDIDVGQALADRFDAIVISPGPGHPAEAGASLAIALACIDAAKPLLGVCLGHQAIALGCGGAIGRVRPVHGMAGPVRHDGTGLFAGMPNPFDATRYHSLAVESLPPDLIPNAWSEDGTIMGMRHRIAPAHGVQFHPESVASQDGAAIIRTFVDSISNRA